MLEAQSLGIPVLAFEGSGGGEDISRQQHGSAAKPSDISDFCRLVIELSERKPELQKRIEENTYKFQERADFGKYADEILDITYGEG